MFSLDDLSSFKESARTSGYKLSLDFYPGYLITSKKEETFIRTGCCWLPEEKGVRSVSHFPTNFTRDIKYVIILLEDV